MENEQTNLHSTIPIPMALQSQPVILRHLEQLLTQEAQLEQNNSSPDSPLAYAYTQTQHQLKIELRRVYRSSWDQGQEEQSNPQIEQRVKTILCRMRKLKELHIYFNDIRKDSGQLEADVQKFMAYLPKGNDLIGKLQSFLSESTVCELLLKQHQKNINPNNFLADIIQFFDFLSRNQLLGKVPQEEISRMRNEDLVLIQNSKIIFRQVCEISDKYSLVQQQLQGAYVHLSFLSPSSPATYSINRKFKEEEEGVQKQMKELIALARKVKGVPAFSYEDTIVFPEEPDLFDEQAQCEFDYSFKHRNQSFFSFLQSLYSNPAETGEKGNLQGGIGSGNFDFIRRKIIRVQMNWHLNRVFSALNVGSHIITQLHDNTTPTPHCYCFTHPSELIKYQLNSKRISFYEERQASPAQLRLLCKNIVVAQREEGFVLRMEMSRVVYPSALHSYYYLLKYLLALSSLLQTKQLYDQELILQITAIKADQLLQWAETAVTLYELIRGKYWGGYAALKEYIGLAMAGRWAEELEWVERQVKNQSQLLGFFSDRQKKAAWINQIIFELDSNYDLTQALQQLLAIQKRLHRVAHIGDSPRLYEQVLNEIIETRNNLKFQRCYSFNALHQLFAFPAAHPSSLSMLAQHLAPLSNHTLPLPHLLRLYHSQTRLKRQVFRAQLYWVNIAQPSVRNKFIISTQRKKATFRDFLDQNAKYLLSIVDQDLAFFIKNLEDVQRAVLLFAQEVERLKLIQTALMLLKPDFPLEDHLAAFSHKQLLGFVGFCSGFNFVQDLYVRRQKRSWVVGQVRRLLNEGKLKFCDLNMEQSSVAQKQLLGGLIFLAHAFQHHITLDDCLRLKQKIIDRGEPSEYHLKLQILRSKRDVVKEYQDSQFLQGAALAQFVQIYELLIHISLNRTISREDVPHKDKLILTSIRNQLPTTYAPFLQLKQLTQMQRLNKDTNTTSRAQTYAAVACLLTEQRERLESGGIKNGEWRVLDYLFMLPQIGIVERRIFCNQLIELKSSVSGEEWRSFNKQSCLGRLRQILQAELLQKINCFLIEEAGASDLLSPNLSITHNLALLNDYTKAQILRQFDQRYCFHENPRRGIELFDQERGVQQDWSQVERKEGGERVFVKKGRANAKRGLLKGGQAQQGRRCAVVGGLQQRVKVQIVKDSLGMRKTIYLLQLEQKRIRDEIAWQTCKLQHNVINKINRFIQESNLDQKQSLINFKYTVNLETIKGIENVIHERTEIFGKKAEAAKRMKEEKEEEAAQGFLTQPHPSRTLKLLSPSELQLHQPSEQDINQLIQPQPNPKGSSLKNLQDQGKQQGQEEETLLQINLRNIFNHVRKIKLFWCWKSMFLGKQNGQNQWTRFSQNVESILHNGANMARMAKLQQERDNCNKQEILCNLIQQENQLLNTHIRNNKINNLTHKLAQFKAQHYTVVA